MTVARTRSAALGLAAALASAPALAQPAAAPAWQDTITLSLQGQVGLTLNPDTPKRNFGQLFSDKPNVPTLNQLLLTVERKTDNTTPAWDVGFKLQGMYGSDARYTHLLGVANGMLNQRYQFDLVDAYMTVHMPLLTAGGIDLKAGVFASPLGFETIDPSTNLFYTHSYIFNFGVPFKHTGLLATLHATDMIDVIVGATTGVNTSFGKGGDNNSSLAGIVGFGLTLLDGDVTVLALSHIGPENPTRTVPNASRHLRYLNDIAVTWKATDKLTLVTELNYIKDDFAKAEAFGIAQHASYAINEKLALNGRAEVFRDGKGFFVGAYPGNLDPMNAQLGKPATVLGGTKTTYGALTVGFTYKPEIGGKITTFALRPEMRIDSSLDNTKPFSGGTRKSALMVSMDAVVGF